MRVDALENVSEAAFQMETANSSSRALKFRRLSEGGCLSPPDLNHQGILESLSQVHRAAAADPLPLQENYGRIWRIEPQAAQEHLAQTLHAGHQHNMQACVGFSYSILS